MAGALLARRQRSENGGRAIGATGSVARPRTNRGRGRRGREGGEGDAGEGEGEGDGRRRRRLLDANLVTLSLPCRVCRGGWMWPGCRNGALALLPPLVDGRERAKVYPELRPAGGQYRTGDDAARRRLAAGDARPALALAVVPTWPWRRWRAGNANQLGLGLAPCPYYVQWGVCAYLL